MSPTGFDFVEKPRTIPALAWSFAALTAYLFKRGMIGSADTVCRALFGAASGAVSWIPWLGHKVDHGLDAVKTRLINYLGAEAARADEGIARSFHGLVQVVEDIGNEFAWQAAALGSLVYYLGKTIALPALKGNVIRVNRDVQTLQGTVGRTKTQAQRTANTVARPLQGPIGKAIDAKTGSVAVDLEHLRSWTIPRVKVLEREVDGTIPADIAGLRARTKTHEGSLSELWKKVRHLDKVTTGVLASALVLSALKKLGLGWLKCTNWTHPTRGFGRHICRMPGHLLEDLLALTTDFLVLTNICTVLPWLEDAASAVGTPLIEKLAGVGAGLCHGIEDDAPPLNVPQTYRPASPSLTLHLP